MFEKNVGDLEIWIIEVGNILVFKDFGWDVKSVNNFIKWY